VNEEYRGFKIRYSEEHGTGVFVAKRGSSQTLSDYRLRGLKAKIDVQLAQWQEEKVRLFDKDNFTARGVWQFCDGVFKGMSEYGDDMDIEVRFYDGSIGHRNNCGEIVLKDTLENRAIEKQIISLHDKHTGEQEQYHRELDRLFKRLKKFKPMKGSDKKRDKHPQKKTEMRK